MGVAPWLCPPGHPPEKGHRVLGTPLEACLPGQMGRCDKSQHLASLLKVKQEQGQVCVLQLCMGGAG